MLIELDQSALLVIDIQARLAPAVSNRQQTIANAAILLKGAQRLGAPVLASEQYPKGLGATVAELDELLPPDARIEKLSFACSAEKLFMQRLADLNRKQVVIAGMETHICVLQTAIGLKNAGLTPFVVADATGSRTIENYNAALDRLRAEGIAIVTTEMVLFEWLQRAGSQEFKDISALVK
ncbi:MAG: hydrolase [Burkholderiales bacterium]|nr:hydrolase [Burkholderiales bacterium]MDQ3195290.1 hydrolase [Pseudomonadota bacterium]